MDDLRAASGYLFLFFVCLYLLTLKGLTTGDDLLHYDLVHSIVTSGRVVLPPGKYDANNPGMRLFMARGRDQNTYLGLPHGLAVASIPLGALGAAADVWLGAGVAVDPLTQPSEIAQRRAFVELRQRPSALLTAAINPVVSALTVVLFFLFAARLAVTLREAFQATLLLGLATVVWPYSSTYWTQPIAAFFLFASLYTIHRAGRPMNAARALSAGILTGAAFLCRFEMLLLSPWLLLYCVLAAPRDWRKRWLAGACFLVGVGFAVMLQGAWNAYRFGNWLEMGTFHQGWRSFRGNIVSVLPLLVASPYRGIVIYSPALILGVIGLIVLLRRLPRLAVTVIGLSASMVLFYSSFSMWRGDTSWGPRFLVPLTPFLLLPASLTLRRWPAAFWVAMLFGLVIQIPAVLGAQDPYILAPYHLPFHGNAWAHFWQSDVVPQWGSVLRGNVEFWWLASRTRGLLALVLAGFAAFAAVRAKRLCWSSVSTGLATVEVAN